MHSFFAEHGLLQKYLKQYEFRAEQLEMADFILERLYNSEHGIVEAGTGTGKTLSYLIPTLLYAVDNEKKVTVTTETKALQKQLIDKDLPLLKNIFKRDLGKEFSYSLCLGGGNYPCRQRFELALAKGKFGQKDYPIIEDIMQRFKEKKIFSRLDIEIPFYLWREFNREGEICNPYKCVFNPVCSFQMAKREWATATLLVMNHYLFFTNIAFDKMYLPNTEIVVFDEAHSVEPIASSQLGFTLGYNELVELLHLFYQPNKKNSLLHIIEDPKKKKQNLDLLTAIVKEAQIFFEKCRSFLNNDRAHLRTREPLVAGNKLVEKLKNFLLLLAESEDDYGKDELLRVEFDLARGKLFLYSENLAAFVYHNFQNYVYWIEKNAEDLLGDMYLKGQPVEIAEIMRKEVMSFYETCFFVSATLAINNDFSYIANRLGLDNYRSLLCKPVFDYKNQAILFIAKHMSDPAGNYFSEQSAMTAIDIIKHVHGNCLMLFTSYKMLKEVKQIISDTVAYPIHSQDEFSAQVAYQNYVADENSILMGTHSFWQGIDLPGDLVRGVIIMRLPFAVPDSPPFQARMERLESKGMNPFMSLQVPEAVIKLKQGFGRLIRTKVDRGVVAILDPRIMQKSYGKIFLNSLPECKVVYSFEELQKEL